MASARGAADDTEAPSPANSKATVIGNYTRTRKQGLDFNRHAMGLE